MSNSSVSYLVAYEKLKSRHASSHRVEVAENFRHVDHKHVAVTPNGPYIEQLGLDLKSPKYLLTKTHCDNYCAFCPPSYKGTLERFIIACSIDTEKGKIYKEYNSKGLVKRAIHLVRDPFDNLVSRYHHALKHEVRIKLKIVMA